MTKYNPISHCPAYLAGSSIYQPSAVSLLCLLPPHMLLLLVHYLYSNWNLSFIRAQLLCIVVCYCHEWMARLYISQSLQGLPSPFFFYFTPICTNMQLSPKHNMYFHGPCFAITNFPHHPIKPPKYQQYFSNLLQEESKQSFLSSVLHLYLCLH